MPSIRIKNFGPIKEGFVENDGFFDIKKCTVFIGNQGTGKSTVAKLFSTFSWLEKALVRGDIAHSEVIRKGKFEREYCTYQNLRNYFNKNTNLTFLGDTYIFHYCDERLKVNERDEYRNRIYNKDYKTPKIMYVPAERNFLSIVDSPEKLKRLPAPLYTFLEEYNNALNKYENEQIELPITNLTFEYQKKIQAGFIKGEGYRLRLSESSSGLHSAVPLFLVTKYLVEKFTNEEASNLEENSLEERQKLKERIRNILGNNKLSTDIRIEALEYLSLYQKPQFLINIVEEIEQNLYPASQKSLLFSLLEFNNDVNENILLLTTHSPYIINYISLVIKGYNIRDEISNLQDDEVRAEYYQRLDKIVGDFTYTSAEDVAIYELKDGRITLLPNYEGIPSDDNYLNESLAETNRLFDELLEIEEELGG